MQPGFDAHRSGHNFVERSISPATAGSLTEEWSTDLAGEIQTPIVQSRSGLLHAIARDDDASSGRLYGLEAATGEVVWTVELDLGPYRNVVPTLIAGADHDVFVGRFGLDVAPYGRLDRFSTRGRGLRSVPPGSQGPIRPGAPTGCRRWPSDTASGS